MLSRQQGSGSSSKPDDTDLDSIRGGKSEKDSTIDDVTGLVNAIGGLVGNFFGGSDENSGSSTSSSFGSQFSGGSKDEAEYWVILEDVPEYGLVRGSVVDKNEYGPIEWSFIVEKGKAQRN